MTRVIEARKMPKADKSEQRYYEPVRKWLTNRKDYYTGGDIYYASGKKSGTPRYFTKTGFRELQCDVVGIKFAGNHYV